MEILSCAVATCVWFNVTWCCDFFIFCSIFSRKNSERCPIAHLWGWGIGCLSWIHSLNTGLAFFLLYWVQYCIIYMISIYIEHLLYYVLLCYHQCLPLTWVCMISVGKKRNKDWCSWGISPSPLHAQYVSTDCMRVLINHHATFKFLYISSALADYQPMP